MQFTQERLDSMRRLHRIAFGDSDAYVDLFFRRRFRPDLCEAAFEGDRALSVVYARPMQFRLFGAPITLPFLTGVATLPEARGRGLASGLVKAMHARLAAMGYPMVLLHPFNHAFYRRLGYGTVAHVSPLALPRDAAVTARAARRSDLPALDDAYRRAFSGRNFWRVRTPQDWDELWQEQTDDGGSVTVFERSGAIIGYSLEFPGELRECVCPGGTLPPAFAHTPFAPTGEGKEWTMGCVLNAPGLAAYLPAPLCDGVQEGGEWLERTLLSRKEDQLALLETY